MTFSPDWIQVCFEPDKHTWGHVWIDCGDGFHKYWCKFCGLQGKPLKYVNEAQMEIEFENKQKGEV